MSRGWAKGTKESKKAITGDLKDVKLRKIVEREAANMREPLWQRSLESVLKELGKERSALSQDRKCAAWKVEAALRPRQRHLVPYSWIAGNLRMGAISTAQSQVSLRRRRNSLLVKNTSKVGRTPFALFFGLNPFDPVPTSFLRRRLVGGGPD